MYAQGILHLLVLFPAIPSGSSLRANTGKFSGYRDYGPGEDGGGGGWGPPPGYAYLDNSGPGEDYYAQYESGSYPGSDHPPPPLPDGIGKDIEGEDVTTTTQNGQVLGKRRNHDVDAGGSTTFVDWYLGIPYARPPIDNLRFTRSQPVENWEGVRQAVRFAPVCPQIELYGYAEQSLQDEDCLYLNIYTPFESSHPNRTYPVMVYIHGGSYLVGGASILHGHLLATHGTIVVTINYRLGFLGFWCAYDSDLPGNYGFWDQIEALRWLQSNIASFRGDPARVTIFGNSAGGASVGFHVLAPSSKGLFHRAIAQSGTPLTFWAIHREDTDLAQHSRVIANIFGCNQSTIGRIADCMRAVPWQTMVEKYFLIPELSPFELTFRPCVDKVLIPMMPRDIIATGQVNNVEFMVGTVKDEWTRNLGSFIEEVIREEAQFDGDYGNGINRASFLAAIEHVVASRFGWDRPVIDVIIHEYTDWSRENEPIENRNQYVHFFTDMSMVVPAVEMARTIHEHHLPVYMYTFNHHSIMNDPDWWGSFHEVELNFIFGSPFTGLNVDEGAIQNYTDVDRDVSRLMMKLWSNFAKFGNPTPRPSETGVRWEQLLPETTDYLYIHANDTRMRTHLRADKVNFWSHLVPSLQIMKPSQTCLSIARTYHHEMWVLASVAMVLVFLVIVCLCIIVRRGRGMHDVTTTTQINGQTLSVRL